jgi:hypothetical protein
MAERANKDLPCNKPMRKMTKSRKSWKAQKIAQASMWNLLGI